MEVVGGDAEAVEQVEVNSYVEFACLFPAGVLHGVGADDRGVALGIFAGRAGVEIGFVGIDIGDIEEVLRSCILSCVIASYESV